MWIYILLVIYILLGQILLSAKFFSKKFYCWSVCLILILIVGLRDVDVGMYDTATVYLPSFRVIRSNDLAHIFSLDDTQYKFVGFVLYSKLIGLLSSNENFYIFMMAWPFYVAITHVIIKRTKSPGYSYIALLALGYFTYSFSMLRGMMALTFAVLAFDAAMDSKWKKYIACVIIGTTFHLTALVMLGVPLIKKVNWGVKVIIFACGLVAILYNVWPMLWKQIVVTLISPYFPTYNYYSNRDAVFADALFIVYIALTCFFVFWKLLEFSSWNIKAKNYMGNSQRNNNSTLVWYNSFNMMLGMVVVGSIFIFMTYILDEMQRMGQYFGLAAVVLLGVLDNRKTFRDKNVLLVFRCLIIGILLFYFFYATLPNMNAIPYNFYFS